MFENIDGQAPEEVPQDTAGNQAELPPAEEKQASEANSTKAERIETQSIRKSTGPRTSQGKQRSKYNTLKHGMYSKKLLLKNESPAEYEALWNELWDDLRPEGTLATEIFGKIFWNLWSSRRFRKAANAQIAEAVEFSEFDRLGVLEVEAWDLEQWASATGGLLKPSRNRFVVRRGIEILQQIRRSVATNGFSEENDRHLLRTLYGTDAGGRPSSGVFHSYILLAICASVAKGAGRDAEIDKSRKLMFEMLDEEIGNLIASENALSDVELWRTKFRIDRALVPSQKALERDMRQETHLTRELARLLSLFEYAQRMYQGTRSDAPQTQSRKLSIPG